MTDDELISIGTGIAALAATAAEAASATIAGAAGLALPYSGAAAGAGLATASAALTGTGAVVGAAGQLMAGASAKASADYRAEQLDMAATESRAASQRQVFERRRQAKLTLSSLQARAAADGGDASNPGIIRLGGDIAARGEYQALSELYLGENRARGLTDEATASRISGSAARTGSYFSAAGTLASGFGSMLGTYGKLTSPAKA